MVDIKRLTQTQDGPSCFSMYGMKIWRSASRKNRFLTELLS